MGDSIADLPVLSLFYLHGVDLHPFSLFRGRSRPNLDRPDPSRGTPQKSEHHIAGLVFSNFPFKSVNSVAAKVESPSIQRNIVRHMASLLQTHETSLDGPPKTPLDRRFN